MFLIKYRVPQLCCRYPSMISHAPLARFQLKCCDLMIMGIRMPKINGFDLYRQLKKSDTSVRVCFLTSFKSMNEEVQKDVSHNRCQGIYQKKPVSISNLANQIEAAIASKYHQQVRFAL
jgi:DNA-binding NarL/FixJ family response regulator